MRVSKVPSIFTDQRSFDIVLTKNKIMGFLASQQVSQYFTELE